MGTETRRRWLLALHVLPGVVPLVAYVILAVGLRSVGSSNALALYLTGMVVEAPLLWAIMAAVRRREMANGEPGTLFPWRRPLAWWWYVVVGIPLIPLCVAIIGGLGSAGAEPIRRALFGWVPDVVVLKMDASQLTGSDRVAALRLLVLGFLGPVLLAGPTQELYFRGFLLPRISGMGGRAPVVNAALFAVYHLAAPWSWPMFFVGSLLWTVPVHRTRSVRIGLFVHVGMLLLMWLSTVLLAMGVISPP